MDFDFSLSFSGHDRAFARRVARAAKKLNLRIFLDEWFKSYLWGKKESVYHEIYGPNTHAVVPIISCNYVDCDNARFELDIALKEEKKRKAEFILPIRLDDSIVAGIQGTKAFLSAEEHTPAKIAQFLREKLDEIAGEVPMVQSPIPQTSDQRQMLGLIVTAAIPNFQELYEKLYPSLPWSKELPKLQACGLIAITETISPTKQAIAAFSKSSEEYQFLEDKWINALSTISNHIDIAPYAALHLIGRKRIDEAIQTLGPIAMGSDLGYWNSVYLDLLNAIVDRYFSSALPENQLLLLNCLGSCLAEARQFDGAIEMFRKMHALAKKHGSTAWIGQSLINSGVALFEAGNREAAIRQYGLARTHAEENKDWRLLGRVLGNLAECARQYDVGAARKLLVESLKAKRRSKDTEGIATNLLQQGNIEIEAGQLRKALRFYELSAKACEKEDLAYLRALSLHNIGNTHRDLGEKAKAVKHFRLARDLAAENGFDYPLSLALLGLGTMHFEATKYLEAKDTFGELLTISRQRSDIESEMTCLHAIAVSVRLLEGSAAATEHFDQAEKYASKQKLGAWFARCIVDRTRNLVDGVHSSADMATIEKRARKLVAAKKFLLAGCVWLHLARLSQTALANANVTKQYYARAIECLLQSTEIDSDTLEWYFEFADWLWIAQSFSEAIEVLASANELAKEKGFLLQQSIAADKAGVYLQNMDRFSEATKMHAIAIKIARRNKFTTLLEGYLNNQGECLRKMGSWPESESTLLEAEQLAADRNPEAVISIIHNRAVLLEVQGKFDEAEKLLQACKRRCQDGEYWSELIRAWEGLAQLSQQLGNNSLSLQRFEKAMQIAKSKKLASQAVRTALNYAWLLLSCDSPKKAITVLSPYVNNSHDQSLSHLLALILGQSYLALGKPEHALEHLEDAMRLSKAIGDFEHHLDAAVAFADALEQKGRFDEAIQWLQSVESMERDPELWTVLMTQLLRVQMKAESPDCQSTYNRIQRFATKHELYADLAELHMMAGEQMWAGDLKDKLKALQAFARACLDALIHDVTSSKDLDDAERSEDDSLSGEILGRSLVLLVFPETAVTLEELKSLHVLFEKWALKTLPHPEFSQFVLTLTEFAIELLPLSKSPQKMSRKLNRLIAQKEQIDTTSLQQP